MNPVLQDMGIIEVEKKFTMTTDTEQRLEEIKAHYMGEKSFCDVYFDTDQHVLMLNDHWLRQRDDQWELKYNHQLNGHDDTSSTTRYTETTDTNEILEILNSKLVVTINGDQLNNYSDRRTIKGDQMTADGEQVLTSLKELIRTSQLKPVVTIETLRRTYTVNSCNVVLDSTDFGYQVGEMEKIVERREDIPTAQREIDEIATKLGKLFDAIWLV